MYFLLPVKDENLSILCHRPSMISLISPTNYFCLDMENSSTSKSELQLNSSILFPMMHVSVMVFLVVQVYPAVCLMFSSISNHNAHKKIFSLEVHKHWPLVSIARGCESEEQQHLTDSFHVCVPGL